MNLLIVEVNRWSVVIARFSAGKTLSFLGADSCPAEKGDIESLLRDMTVQGDHDSTVIFAMDPALFSYREMELPITDRRKLREILPLELKGETILDTSGLAFDSIPMADGRVLAIWGKRDVISNRIETMAAMGLEPATVTSAPYHWRNLLTDDSSGYTALSDGTAFSVYRDRTPIYFRALGNADMAGEIAATVAALEVNKGIGISNVLVFGKAATASSPDTSAVTFTPLPLPAVLSAGFNNDDDARRFAGISALAAEVRSGAPVNFRYGELAYTAGLKKLKKKLVVSAVLASLLVTGLLVEAGIRYYMVKRDLDSVNASIATIYHGIFPSRKKAVDEVAEVRSEIKRLGGDIAGQSVLKMMKQLSEIKGTTIAGFYESDFEGGHVRLKGDADSFQAVNDFKLRADKILSTAEVSDIKSKAGGGVTFFFRGAVKEGGN